MDRWQYLFVLAACLAITAPLEMFGAGVYRQAWRAAGAVLPVAAVFVVWDAVAIAAHVWTYNPRFVTGLELPGSMPIEEAAVLRRDPAVRAAHLHRRRRHPRTWLRRVAAPRGAAVMTGLGYTAAGRRGGRRGMSRWSSRVLRTGLFRRAAYWISMVIVLGFQIPVDGWLTKLSAPIVIYDERHTSGIRFPFDIPVEDFLFGWAMVTAVLLLWERQRRATDGRRQAS